MPADSRRWALIEALVAKIQAAAGASYFYDLSGATTAVGTEADSQRFESGLPVTIRVEEGDEAIVKPVLNDTLRTAQLVLYVDIDVIETGDLSLPEAVNRVMVDVRRVIDTDQSLGGLASHVFVSSIEAPQYHFAQQVRRGRVRLAVTVVYDWLKGTVTAPNWL